MKTAPKVLIIASHGDTTKLLVKELQTLCAVLDIVIEDPQSKIELVKKRIRKLGLAKVIGQILFKIIIAPILIIFSQRRKTNLSASYGIDNFEFPDCQQIQSVNSEQARAIISKVDCDYIIINGTRIISQKTLNTNKAVWLNIHTGITPKYRGVHGGYWALWNNDKKNFGVTLHRVDSGIDTGSIVDQKIIGFSPKDSFVTYPLIQYIEGIELLKQYLLKTENSEEQRSSKKNLESHLWYHPTFFQYLNALFFKGVK